MVGWVISWIVLGKPFEWHVQPIKTVSSNLSLTLFFFLICSLIWLLFVTSRTILSSLSLLGDEALRLHYPNYFFLFYSCSVQFVHSIKIMSSWNYSWFQQPADIRQRLPHWLSNRHSQCSQELEIWKYVVIWNGFYFLWYLGLSRSKCI